MVTLAPPLRFDPAFETVRDDEDETQRGLTEAMLSIARRTHEDTGHTHRAVHAKAHGYVRATFEVLPDLPADLAQGLFAKPGCYDALLRFSTTPGDILDDNVSMPRGAALKVLGVAGERLPGSEGETTQNYVMGNSTAFQIADAKGFLRQLRVLAATTGRAEPAKHVVSILSRNAEALLEKVGQSSATLVTVGGQAPTHLLGESFHTQAALLHGAYYAKVGMFPVSDELVALHERPLDLAGRPNAIREEVRAHFAGCPATWELRVQLATDADAMPIEDAAAEWSQDVSPYRTIARITAVAQDAWSDELRDLVEEHLAFAPWTGLAAHRPLGSIMRARRPAYAAAKEYRARTNGVTIEEPTGSAPIYQASR